MNELVAVTGADGFIGSHLVEALVARGHKVRAMGLYNSFGSYGWMDTLSADVMDNVEVVLGDVRDAASARELVKGADTVYHLAALIAIPYSYRNPRSYVDTNVIGTLNVLDAAREYDVRRMVHTSTSETYGSAQTVPITEFHPTVTQSPYAASKLAADKLAESYYCSFSTPVVTMRPFNTFGPRQSARAVIPTIISQLAAGFSEIKLGSLDTTRDFLYVKDTAQAFIAVGTAPADAVVGEVFNAGTNVEVSIGQLAQDLIDVFGANANVVEDLERVRPKDSEVMRLLADASKLTARTGWTPSFTRQEGLAETIEWFCDPANLARYKPAQYMQ